MLRTTVACKWDSDPVGSLEFIEHTSATLHRYQFGRKSTDFLLCRKCGAYVGATMQFASKRFGIVNVRVLHSLLNELPEAEAMEYENEGLAERIVRRENRWTPIAVG